MRREQNMKKRILCLALAVCALMVLTACGQQKEVYPNQPRQDTATQQPTDAPAQQPAQQQITDYDNGPYNPASEEGGDSEPVADSGTPAPTMYSDYAGATPVKIDPVDKPTPTPYPKLTFTYANYTIPFMNLSFEGPANWVETSNGTDTYTLTNPDPAMDYAAKIEIKTVPVSKTYSQKDLTKEVKTALDAIRSDMNFASFDTSSTATRDFIDGNGVYATFKGNLRNLEETGVAGRVIVNEVKKTMYLMTVTYPRGLADTFAEGVYNKVRHSLKLTN